MAQIFPEWTNKLPVILAVVGLGTLACVVGFFWYFAAPAYTDVGYRPRQPVAYSHKLHAGDLGIDCLYCHTTVEHGPRANVPPTQTCMNCHTLLNTDSEKLLPVRESWAGRRPIEWVRVHDLPDYAYFDHSVHISAGVGCESCHGNVAQMDEVTLVETLSMGWCLDCHRNANMHLRPAEAVTQMDWIPPVNQAEFAARVTAERGIAPPEDCAACHR